MLFSSTVQTVCLKTCDLVQRQAGPQHLGSFLMGAFTNALAKTTGTSQRQVQALGRWIVHQRSSFLVAHCPEPMGQLIILLSDPKGLQLDTSKRKRPICCRTESMTKALPEFIRAAYEFVPPSLFWEGVTAELAQVSKGLSRFKDCAKPELEDVLSRPHGNRDLVRFKHAWDLLEPRQPFPFEVKEPDKRPEPEQLELPTPPQTWHDSSSHDSSSQDLVTEEMLAAAQETETLGEGESFETFRRYIDLDSPAPIGIYPDPAGDVILLVSVMGVTTTDTGVEQTIFRGGAIVDRETLKEVTHKDICAEHGLVKGPHWWTDPNGTTHVLKGVRPAGGSRGVIGKFWTNVKRQCSHCFDLRPYNFYDPDLWNVPNAPCLACQGRRLPTRENGDIENLKRWFLVRMRPENEVNGTGPLLMADVFDNENRYHRYRNAIKRRQKKAQTNDGPTTALPTF